MLGKSKKNSLKMVFNVIIFKNCDSTLYFILPQIASNPKKLPNQSKNGIIEPIIDMVCIVFKH